MGMDILFIVTWFGGGYIALQLVMDLEAGSFSAKEVDMLSDTYNELIKHLKNETKPTPAKPWIECEFKDDLNFSHFLDFFSNIYNPKMLDEHMSCYFFRGQADSEWGLVPTLYRLLKGFDIKDALNLEYDSIIHFKRKTRGLLDLRLIPEEHEIAEWLGLMQHYGAPTRMLDWTVSCVVAFYFAVTSEPFEKDGCLWFFNSPVMNSFMENEYSFPSEKELEFIVKDKDNFVKFGVENATNNVRTYLVERQSERVISQQSVFSFSYNLFCDHAKAIGEIFLKNSEANNSEQAIPLVKILLSPVRKKEIRQYLNKMNVTAATLFPGVEGIGRSIYEMINMQKK